MIIAEKTRKRSAAAPIVNEPGSVAARIEALRQLVAVTNECVCDRCFMASMLARDRIAALEART